MANSWEFDVRITDSDGQASGKASDEKARLDFVFWPGDLCDRIGGRCVFYAGQQDFSGRLSGRIFSAFGNFYASARESVAAEMDVTHLVRSAGERFCDNATNVGFALFAYRFGI